MTQPRPQARRRGDASVSETDGSSRLVAIVFTDLVDSTGLKTRLGDQAAAALIGRHRSQVLRLLGDTAGREIDHAGDGFFLSFETPSAAGTFALRLQQIHHAERDLPRVRIGIHLGEVTERPALPEASKPLLVEGLAVDLAARIQSLAGPGQILMSAPVFDATRQRLGAVEFGAEVAWRAHGPYRFQGLDDPVQIGEVGFVGMSPLQAPPDSSKARRAVAAGDELTLGWRPAVGLDIPGRPHWRLERHLGSGAVGETWLGAHEKTQARRVYKFCFHADRLRGLKREVALLRLLKQKLGVRDDMAQLIDWEFEQAPYFLEEEYSESGDLLEWARALGGIGAVPLDVRVGIVAQIAEALTAAHEAGVLHRDLKPANVLVSGASGEPHVRLTDFGIGLVLHREMLLSPGVTVEGLTETLVSSSSTSGAGTRLYMAPELMEGRPATPLSDLYSLGVILYQMVVGDFSRALAPGWEDDVDDALLRADIAACVDGHPERRLAGAMELAKRLRELDERAASARGSRRRRFAGLGVAAALVLAIAGYQVTRFLQDRANARWARETALPEIVRLAGDEQYAAAYTRAQQVKQYVPDDPLLAQLWPRITNEIALATDPSGAKVWYREYGDLDGEWLLLGETPLEATVPLGAFRLRIEKQGHQTREIAASVPTREGTAMFRGFVERGYRGLSDPTRLDLQLDPSARARDDMVPVDAAEVRMLAFGRFDAPTVQLDRYWIDRTEVTNAQFKEFVDAGGYDRPDFWKTDFVRDTEQISWREATGSFVDSTGARGPASWAGGEYPRGEQDYPVRGVSWYEAAAYAAFRGKELPTLHHFSRASIGYHENLAEAMVKLSNFGDGPAPVGTHAGIAFSGAHDMAGNVAEWLWNSDESGHRYVQKSSWDDATYTFSIPVVDSPWSRNESRGFRCALYPGGEGADALRAPIPFLKTDWATVPAMPDELFAVVTQASYDPAPLDAKLESSTETPWGRSEHVTVNAAYRGERLPLWIMLPRTAPPYQAVVVFPGAEAVILTDRPPEVEIYRTVGQLFVSSGRAVVLPTYSDTFERNDGRAVERIYSREAADIVKRWKQDLGRTLDYLEERNDFDGAKTAYLGLSMGTVVAPLVLPPGRFQAALLWAGGFNHYESAEVATVQVAALKRMSLPALMINGRYDLIHPPDLQEKFFEYLGTPAEDKRYIVYESGHSDFPYAALVRDNLAWLDRYLGKVEQIE